MTVSPRLCRHPLTSLAVVALLAAGSSALAPAARAAESAVVFMYHRFGESAYPSTNIRLDRFDAHIAELAAGRYRVLPLPEIVEALRTGKPLPDFAIGLSIDDAYASVYREAWPRLRRAGLPFTLFVATDAIDQKNRGMMSWPQIRELAEAGVTIGAHSASHLHMPAADPATIRTEIARSNARFQAMLGGVPALFAYPFGEASRAAADLVGAAGYRAAFGQHSGVLHGGADIRYLPRFAMNEHYGAPDRFRLAARALPLKVTELSPADPVLDPAHNPPEIAFTVDAGLAPRLGALTCFSSQDGRTAIEREGERRIVLRVAKPFPAGRARINCTLPGADGRWRWFGTQYVMPRTAR